MEYRSWLKLRYEQEKILQLIMSVSDRSKLSPRSQSVCTGDGTTLRAYHFKAVVFVVVPFCRLLKWFRFLEISNNSCSSLPMDSLAILHRLSSFQSWPLLKTMHFGFLKFRSLCLLSLWQKSPSCWQTESTLFFLLRVTYILHEPGEGSWLLSVVIFLALRKKMGAIWDLFLSRILVQYSLYWGLFQGYFTGVIK